MDRWIPRNRDGSCPENNRFSLPSNVDNYRNEYFTPNHRKIFNPPHPTNEPHEPSQEEIKRLHDLIIVMESFAYEKDRWQPFIWDKYRDTVEHIHGKMMTKAFFRRACGCPPSSWAPVDDIEIFLRDAHLSVVKVAPMFDVIIIPIGVPGCPLCEKIERKHALEISEDNEEIFDELVTLVIDTYTTSNLSQYLGVDVMQSAKSRLWETYLSVEKLKGLFDEDELIFNELSSLVQDSYTLSMVAQYAEMVEWQLLKCQPYDKFYDMDLGNAPQFVFIEEVKVEEPLMAQHENEWFEVKFEIENSTFEVKFFTDPSFFHYMRFLTLVEISFFWFRDGYSEFVYILR